MINLFNLHSNPEQLPGYKDRFKVPELAYKNARDDRKGERWSEAEPYIMKDSKWAFWYALYILEDRWPEAEPYIMKDPEWAYRYARNILTGKRWPEAEPYIMKDPPWAFKYASHVVERRWPEAEPYIMQDPMHWDFYVKEFRIN